MPDYIYLLENRLSPEQQSALRRIAEAARAHQMTVFLTGGAVRDFTSGSPVRDLDVSVQGNALKLLKNFQKSDAVVMGTHEPSQTLYVKFPGGCRVEISSTRSEHFSKPGKPEYQPANILEDLRRRDFTVNAMALSLNEGSYGLLLDPLNGQADIETKHLRLVSNYGFIEDPARLVRAARFVARYGWTMEERTQQRYQTAKEEDYFHNISAFSRGYELEELAHEEDPLKVLQHLESEGWMKQLFAPWTAAKADVNGLDELRELVQALQVQGVNPDTSAPNLQLLTAKLAPADCASLKRLMPRKGFVAEWDSLEKDAKALQNLLLAKDMNVPSASWKLLTTHKPEAVLWLALKGKGAALQTRLKNFFQVWPEARQRIPYALMQEMRIVPSLPGYQDLQRALFFQLMDNKLKTEPEMRAFLEPYSPPAPPPPVSHRRPKAKKAESRKKPRVPKAVAVAVPVAVPAESAEQRAGVDRVKQAAGRRAAATEKAVADAKTKPAEKKVAVKAKKALPAKKAAKPAKKAKPVKKKVAPKKKPVKPAKSAKKKPLKKVAAKKAAKPVKPKAKKAAKKPSKPAKKSKRR